MNQATADPFMRPGSGVSAPAGGLMDAMTEPRAEEAETNASMPQKRLWEYTDHQYVPDMPVSWIAHWDQNPRKMMRDAQLQELADSIAGSGLQQPIVVRALIAPLPDYPAARVQVVMGARRLRATQLAGLPTIRCFVRVGLDDKEALALAFLENVNRESLTPIEEAMGYNAMLAYYTQTEIAAKIGCTQASISNALRLLRLPNDVQIKLAEELIAPSTARLLLRWQDNPDIVSRLAEVVIQEKLSSHALEGKAMPGSIRRILDSAGLFAGIEDEQAQQASPVDAPQANPPLQPVVGQMEEAEAQGERPDTTGLLRPLHTPEPSAPTPLAPLVSGEPHAPITSEEPQAQEQSAAGAADSEAAPLSTGEVSAPLPLVPSVPIAEEPDSAPQAVQEGGETAPVTSVEATVGDIVSTLDTAVQTADTAVQTAAAPPVVDKREERTPQASAASAPAAPSAKMPAVSPVAMINAFLPEDEYDWMLDNGFTPATAMAELRRYKEEAPAAAGHSVGLSERHWERLLRLSDTAEIAPHLIVENLISEAFNKLS